MKSDIQIANEATLAKITQVAASIGIDEDNISSYGKYMSKIDLDLIDDEKVKSNNLILVTAITPTKAGNGKTTVSIGLAMALNHIGKSAVVALREPSLGPCFGMKGGAAGGGYAQVLPMENINLHFTGDFHAITSANNMISALLDNYIYQNRNSSTGLREIKWRRVLDVNDRNLRYIATGLRGPVNGIVAETGFDITPASEIMAILCLSTGVEDMRRRIGNILLATTNEGKPFTVNDLGITGAIMVLLKDAINPNLVQTIDNTAAIVHGGPFANIAHGCNSIIATKIAMSHSEYTITEGGFGADLGAEKFMNIKCRAAGICPKATVIVATAQSLKMHGGVPISAIKEENIEGLQAGLANLDKHIQNMQSFSQSVIVTFNRFATDTDAEIALVEEHCKQLGVGFASNTVFANGAIGGEELAKLVVETVENKPSPAISYTYDLEDTVETKIEKVSKNIYGANHVTYAAPAKRTLKFIEEMGVSHYPICIAKTQYSFSDNDKAYGVAKDFELHVRDIIINNGSEMLVVIMGEIMRMPGLPKVPQAMHMDLIDGEIIGLS